MEEPHVVKKEQSKPRKRKPLRRKYPVVIEIRDSHEVEGEVHSSEMLCDGTLAELPPEHGGGWELAYTEQSEGLEGSPAALRVQHKTVSLSREGEFPLEITLEQGVRHHCYYNTPSGMMHLGVFARSVESEMSDNGGNIKLHYTLDFSADMMSANRMEISIRRAGE
ncbi:MAG: DUF1934 domain-containing protein [Oscillospiraceae bacterium]|jgi:uncharacterized beta-barrel protein YwiB (DUF1934 family)|nr:DUF1934 domain-containing protein [Oscillospiraceae bacterium]